MEKKLTAMKGSEKTVKIGSFIYLTDKEDGEDPVELTGNSNAEVKDICNAFDELVVEEEISQKSGEDNDEVKSLNELDETTIGMSCPYNLETSEVKIDEVKPESDGEKDEDFDEDSINLKHKSAVSCEIDLLAEISQSPHILSEVDAALKTDVDEYLKVEFHWLIIVKILKISKRHKSRIRARAFAFLRYVNRGPEEEVPEPQQKNEASFLSELKQKLLLSPSEAARTGTRYNMPLMNSLVLYVGIQSMASNASLAIFMAGAALDIFQALILELDTEGRYLFLNAVANQFHYPDNHTHYFSLILLYLLSESNQVSIS
ncbi:hypothetical protein QVD17_16506 [Tagetes erecta]|uniref:CCR4-Not complex component Not1 C-terminal domain-containing protein n=1 Tax=Tagetes erecta TaxID=13708 RepID=A0AAD8KV78_TARER|nr:hypothetical protein QVD17_16506 [Tagetes erecta]